MGKIYRLWPSFKSLSWEHESTSRTKEGAHWPKDYWWAESRIWTNMVMLMKHITDSRSELLDFTNGGLKDVTNFRNKWALRQFLTLIIPYLVWLTLVLIGQFQEYHSPTTCSCFWTNHRWTRFWLFISWRSQGQICWRRLGPCLLFGCMGLDWWASTWRTKFFGSEQYVEPTYCNRNGMTRVVQLVIKMVHSSLGQDWLAMSNWNNTGFFVSKHLF